jgi:hypothetical protein
LASLLATHLKLFLAAGGAAGDITVTGVLATDVIVGVSAFALTEGTPNTFSGIANLASEFTTATDKVNNAGGTSTANKLLVIVVERSPGKTATRGQTGYR